MARFCFFASMFIFFVAELPPKPSTGRLATSPSTARDAHIRPDTFSFVVMNLVEFRHDHCIHTCSRWSLIGVATFLC
jgi:hypothetical protein